MDTLRKKKISLPNNYSDHLEHSPTKIRFFLAAFGVVFTGYLLVLYNYSQEPGLPISFILSVSLPGLIFLMLASFLCLKIVDTKEKHRILILESEARFELVNHLLPILFLRIDQRGTIVWTKATLGINGNRIYQKMIGRNIREYIVGENFFSMDKVPENGTVKVQKIHSSIMYVDYVISDSGRKNQYNENFFDICMINVTEREKATSQNNEMEKRLFHLKKMESRSTLTSGLAHDFNNILQTVNDITDQVTNDTQELETREKMELISETMTDAQFLISEILDLGSRKSFIFSPLNVTDFLYSIIPTYEKQIGKLYTVTFTSCHEPLWVFGDTNYLKRVFQNLFGNAKDAMPEGGSIRIECSRSHNGHTSNTVVIRFSDSGEGIANHIVDKIFDPFYTTKKKGTGLGLALVQRIVALHKGEISIEKTGKRGTTFCIQLPEKIPESAYEDQNMVLHHWQATTVMVLDDDPKMRKFLSFFLTDLGYKIFETSSVEDGVSILKKNKSEIRMVIMDWKIGEKDPHQAIKLYRSILPELIILVVSGYQPIEQSIEEMNIFQWITKPYNKKFLDQEIQRALYFTKKTQAA